MSSLYVKVVRGSDDSPVYGKRIFLEYYGLNARTYDAFTSNRSGIAEFMGVPPGTASITIRTLSFESDSFEVRQGKNSIVVDIFKNAVRHTD